MMKTEASEKHPVATVLVVDDKPANIKVLFDALKGTGYRTLAALDGESAIHQAALAQPDLVLMDVMMPGIDGFEACRRLKTKQETRHIPVIFMTALAATDDKLKGFQAGGVDYLTKPLQHEEVLARIGAHLNRQRMWADVTIYSGILLSMGVAESLNDAWAAIGELPARQPDIAGLAVWLASDGELALSHATGFAGENPASWPRPGGTYASVALTDARLGPVFTERRQTAGEAWPPAGTGDADPGAHILTPVCCRDSCYGVLSVWFATAATGAAFDERLRWHRILAQSLGNAIFQAHSFEAIRELTEQLQQENESWRTEASASAVSSGMIGTSPALRRVLDQVALVAPTETAVLILGESGTGKELLAQAIHEQSQRREAPMIRVNCAAIPHDLFESEFFGHVKGAFTGAVKDRAGRFELANGGTLFLDEVGEIPLALQGKLLRVLQEGTFERVGGDQTRRTDVRLITATNRDLQQAVKEGRFRQDLYYRLSVFPLTLPPLRERREDISALVRHFAARAARKTGLPPPVIRDEMLTTYRDYDWPGNIRELQNEVERAMILSRGGPLMLTVPGHTAPPPKDGKSTTERLIRETEWQAMQRENLLRALRQTSWRVDGPGGAAELLDLRPTTLRSRMKAMDISRPV